MIKYFIVHEYHYLKLHRVMFQRINSYFLVEKGLPFFFVGGRRIQMNDYGYTPIIC